MSDGNTPGAKDSNILPAQPNASQEPEKIPTGEETARPAEARALNRPEAIPEAPSKKRMVTVLEKVHPDRESLLGGGANGPERQDDPDARHEAQLEKIPKGYLEFSPFQKRFVKGSRPDPTRRGEKQSYVLLNLIVALEWVPSVETTASLKAAFREASALLADVTDGYISIGEVLIGGPELMPWADIQIFASNRLFPRSSVDAMHNPKKYRPIRLGRGLWQKNNRASLPWNTRRGYATIVHELGHHALGLKDQYLDMCDGLVTPQHSLVTNTIMSNLVSSELLAPRPNRSDGDVDSEWEALRTHESFHKWLTIPAKRMSNPKPPTDIPPTTFSMTDEAAGQAEELLLILDEVTVPGKRPLNLNHTWVYVLRMDGDPAVPQALYAQGSYESRSDGFRLLGARAGDYGDRVLLVGTELGAEQPANLAVEARIVRVEGGIAVLDTWQDVTPTNQPTIDVIVTGAGNQPKAEVELQSFQVPLKGYVFPLGDKRKDLSATADNLTTLDGHVLCISNSDGKRQLAIANFSLGGSPGSAYPAHPNPIPAGSSDGNAMLFFTQSVRPTKFSYAKRAEDAQQDPADKYQIVTTTNQLNPSGMPWDKELKPRSYLFSVTTNYSLKAIEGYLPTLVLYYDEDSRDDEAEKLSIYRFNQNKGRWEELNGVRDTPEHYYLAAPIDSENAPGLFGADGERRPEHYCILLGDVPPANPAPEEEDA